MVPPDVYINDVTAKAKAREEAIAAQIAADEAAAFFAQEEIDRLESARLYEEESARMRARDKANQLAYQTYLAEIAAKTAADKAASDKIIAERIAADKKNADEFAAQEAARQKAYNDYIKSTQTCPEFYEYSVTENRCVSSYSIQNDKVTALAKQGQGFIMRDMNRRDPQVTLVKTCPAGYVATYEKVIGEGAPQYMKDINCRAASSLSYQELELQARLDAGMAQTSDGNWHLTAAAAATAQSKIDATNAAAAKLALYTPRQNNINNNICAVGTDGWINNPYSTTNFSLSEYIGRFKVTASELTTARASCPNSVYSSGRIANGASKAYLSETEKVDIDNKLGYKPYEAPITSGATTGGNVMTEPTTKPCTLIYSNCNLPQRYETIQIPWNADCSTYQPPLPMCAPPQQWI